MSESLEKCMAAHGLPETERKALRERYSSGQTIMIGSSQFVPPEPEKPAKKLKNE